MEDNNKLIINSKQGNLLNELKIGKILILYKKEICLFLLFYN